MLDCRYYCCLLSITVTYEFFSPFPFSGRNDYGNNFSLNYWESKYFKNLMAQGYSSMFSWVIFSLLLLLLGAPVILCCWSIRQLGGKTMQDSVNNHVRNKACSALSQVLGDDDLEYAELFALVNYFILLDGLTQGIYRTFRNFKDLWIYGSFCGEMLLHPIIFT